MSSMVLPLPPPPAELVAGPRALLGLDAAAAWAFAAGLTATALTCVWDQLDARVLGGCGAEQWTVGPLWVADAVRGGGDHGVNKRWTSISRSASLATLWVWTANAHLCRHVAF